MKIPYCGLVDARINTSEKDLTGTCTKKLSYTRTDLLYMKNWGTQ